MTKTLGTAIRIPVLLAGLIALGVLAAPAHAEDRGVSIASVAGNDVLSASALQSAGEVRLVKASPIVDASSETVLTACGACGTNACGCQRPDPCCFTRDKPCGNPCKWQFDASLASWVPGINGDITTRGRTVSIDSTPMDVIENIDKVEFLFGGEIRGYYGPWSFGVVGQTVTFGDSVDAQEGAANVGVELDLTIVQFDVAYCLGKEKLCDGGRRTYEAYIGARYFELGGRIDPSRLPGVSQSVDFVDPLVGGRIKWDPCSKWSFDVQADIGGFGIGSDFSWSARVGAEYSFARVFSMELGMAALDIDYTEGSFAWDALMWGPYIKLRFQF